MTNFDRIKGMSVEEISAILENVLEADVCLNKNGNCYEDCVFRYFCDLNCGEAKEWLESEVEE